MKKLWLQLLVVFCLGVVTVPGVLAGVHWWRNSDIQTMKFVDFQTEAGNSDSNISVAVGEQTLTELNEFDTSLRFPSRPHKADVSPFADEFDSPAVGRAAKPVRENLDVDFEPDVLAQNSPSRKPASKPTFEAPSGFTLDDEIGDAPVRQRTASTNPKPELPDGIESLVDANLSDEQKAKLTTLREKLAELTKAKAELVNEQTLEETIFSLEKQISNLHAAQKLLSAQQILRALAEEFPDSPAAAKARRMLEAAGSMKSMKPAPDPLSALPNYR